MEVTPRISGVFKFFLHSNVNPFLYTFGLLSSFSLLSSLSVPFLSFRQPFVSGDRWFSSQANQTGEQEKLRITARNSERGPFPGLLKKRNKNLFFPVPPISFRFRTFVDERMIIPDLSSLFPLPFFSRLRKSLQNEKAIKGSKKRSLK